MEKQRLFKIMANAKTSILKDLSAIISKKYDIVIIKEPLKTLTMIKLREPVKSSLFYIGEVIVSEAMVEVNGTKGMAVTMGDDFDKVLCMAIIDAGFNEKLNEMEIITKELLELEDAQNEKVQKENAMHLKTMVNFNSMDREVNA